MKKLLIVSFLSVILVSLMGGVALAGGWTTISYGASHDPNDIMNGTGGAVAPGGFPDYSPGDGEAIWNPEGGVGSPHGGFSASTSRCRVCHAVHMAGAGSWRLLRSGDSTDPDGGGPLTPERRGMDRESECNYCHGVTGATKKRPWRPKSYAVKGEHTLGTLVIPDASVTAPFNGTLGADGLNCGSCHTVHGANSLSAAETLQDIGYSLNAGNYAAKILRQDPNQDGRLLAENFNGASSIPDMTATDDNGIYATLSNFCGDCHNQNPNWDRNDADDLTSGAATSTAYRNNPISHVQGPAADGSLEVYGATSGIKTTVANWGNLSDANGNNNGGIDPVLEQNTKKGCRGCHAASNAGNESAGTWYAGGVQTAAYSAWPHQTQGAKLLFDTFTEGTTQQAANTNWSGTVRGDATRVLPNMDKLCAKCHRKGGDVATPVDGQGVGLSF